MNVTGAQEERSVASALTRVIDAGERFLGTRVDLARLELGRVLRWGAVLAAGALLGLGGWAVLLAAIVLALRPHVTPAESLAVIGGVHLAGGAALALFAAGRVGAAARPETERTKTDEPLESESPVARLEGP